MSRPLTPVRGLGLVLLAAAADAKTGFYLLSFLLHSLTIHLILLLFVTNLNILQEICPTCTQTGLAVAAHVYGWPISTLSLVFLFFFPLCYA